MDIKKYSGYFHDGTIISIKDNGEKIEIWMESAEIIPKWEVKGVELSNSKTILGKLILSGVTKIFVNNVLVEQFKQNYDDGEILSLSINEGSVDLMIKWCNFPPKERTSHFESISIQASSIYWENIPNTDILKQS